MGRVQISVEFKHVVSNQISKSKSLLFVSIHPTSSIFGLCFTASDVFVCYLHKY